MREERKESEGNKATDVTSKRRKNGQREREESSESAGEAITGRPPLTP